MGAWVRIGCSSLLLDIVGSDRFRVCIYLICSRSLVSASRLCECTLTWNAVVSCVVKSASHWWDSDVKRNGSVENSTNNERGVYVCNRFLCYRSCAKRIVIFSSAHETVQ
jgi:hypothetical protein